MQEKIVHFIKYNNAMTLVVVMCFSGFGVAYAASPEVRDAVYSAKETVVSVDNRQIVSTDLDGFDFNLKIDAITEDEHNYYVVYSYRTLAIEDGVWQETAVEKNLKVDKEALNGKDLGLYTAKELGDNIDYERSYLKRAQKIEQGRGESQKVVTTEYSGLVGKLLDPESKVIEGYTPVIPEPVPEVPVVAEIPIPEPVATPVVEQEPQSQPIQEPVVVTPPEPLEPSPEITPEAAVTTETDVATSTQNIIVESDSISAPPVAPEVIPELVPEILPLSTTSPQETP